MNQERDKTLKARELTPRQQTFVREYLIDLNATKAAERAGYSKKTANEQGARLLAHVSVADAIQAGMNQRSTRLEISADRVLQEIAKLAFANMMDYVRPQLTGGIVTDFSKLTHDQAAAIQEVTVEEYTERTGQDDNGKPQFERVKRVRFKLADKRGNLELLGKHLGLFKEGSVEENNEGLRMLVSAIQRGKELRDRERVQ